MIQRFAVLAVFGLIACGGPLRYEPRATAKAPGTDIKIVADVRKEQNSTKLNVSMEHLPPPNAVQEGSKHFVVWQRKDSGTAWTRISALVYKESDRVGKLEDATVPETAFDLMVTAEEKPDVASPSAQVVVDQPVNR